MKKLIDSLFAMALIAFTFSSCADVPEPYDDPNANNGSDTTVVTNDSVLINETFASSFGTFTLMNITGTPWKIDYQTAKATGYDNTAKTTTASESYLVSKAVDLSAVTSAYLSLDYIFRYKRDGASDKVLITSNYTGDPATTTWTVLNDSWTEGSDWTTFSSFSKDIPSDFIGKNNVVIALYYSCTSTNSSTMEVKNLVLKKGTAPATPVTPVTPVEGVYASETFASSFGTFTAKNISGTPWIIDYSAATGTGYDSQTKTTTASENYLVSSAMDLSASKGATISFDYVLRYLTYNGAAIDGVTDKVLITSNYTGNPTTTTWTDITGTLTEGSDYKTFYNYSKSIPTEFIGKSGVVVALYFKCSSEKSSTWEIKNLTIKEGTSGGDSGGDVSGNTITASLSSFGLSNAAALSTLTLSDGTTLTFSVGDGTSSPAYYTSGTAARIYAKNTITVASSTKKIKSVVLTCLNANSTDYVGNKELYGTADGTTKLTPTISNLAMSFSGFSSNSFKIVNDYTEAKGGVQLRFSKIAITYAE